VGLPVSRCGPLFGEAAGWRVQQQGGGAEGASEQAGPAPPDRRTALTLGEWVEEYLDAHQGERVTVAKLRWLLGKATAELGEWRVRGEWEWRTSSSLAQDRPVFRRVPCHRLVRQDDTRDLRRIWRHGGQ
jgi:hypothetical protein